MYRIAVGIAARHNRLENRIDNRTFDEHGLPDLLYYNYQELTPARRANEGRGFLDDGWWWR